MARPRLTTLLVLVCCACKTEPKQEQAGAAPPFHDQHLITRPLVTEVSPDAMPAALAVNVRANAIELQDAGVRLLVPRGQPGQPKSDSRGSRLVQVPVDDRFSVWRESSVSGIQSVFAEHTDELGAPWLVLEYQHSEAITEPLVVSDRVAVFTRAAIIHAPLSGGASRSLWLAHTPNGQASSQGGHLVWLAEKDDREYVLSTDAAFARVTVEFECPRDAKLLAAVLVGDSLLLASVEHGGSYDLVVYRQRTDGSLLEVLRSSTPGKELRLLADGSQAWLYTARQLWWIGNRSHAKVLEFDEPVSAIAADDGLLFWQLADGVHVAGQPVPEFNSPFIVPLAIGGDDGDPFAPQPQTPTQDSGP